MTTEPDIYTVEARRRLADACEEGGQTHSAKMLRDNCDAELWPSSVAALATTLRELNWQPPVDPDEVVVAQMAAIFAFCDDGDKPETMRDLPTFKAALAAYRAGKAAGGAA